MTNDPNIHATMNAKQIGMKCGCFFVSFVTGTTKKSKIHLY